MSHQYGIRWSLVPFCLLFVIQSGAKGIFLNATGPKDFMIEGIDDRFLQEQVLTDTTRCYSSTNEKENRFCTFENTPREGTFLLVSCPDSKGDDLSRCECTIGVGLPEDAPNTPTCGKCSFCRDGTLSYNCENVARGTCIGRNCADECVASLEYASAAAPRTALGLTTGMTLSLLSLLFLNLY